MWSRLSVLARALPTGVGASPSPLATQLRHASKAASGTGGVTRSSNPKYRGVKVLGDQPVNAGGIIMRQVSRRYTPGENARIGKDYTIYSTVTGFVEFQRVRLPKPRHFIHVREHSKEEHAEHVAKRIAYRKAEKKRRSQTWQFTVEPVARVAQPSGGAR